MSREIKFRALKDDMSNCNWVYGFIAYSKDDTPMISDDGGETFHTCLKGTEGQYTGLKDVNGKKIYDGDILKHSPGIGCEWPIRYSKVVYNDASFWEEHKHFSFILSNHDQQLEVIGNIYENPDLYEKNEILTGTIEASSDSFQCLDSGKGLQ